MAKERTNATTPWPPPSVSVRCLRENSHIRPMVRTSRGVWTGADGGSLRSSTGDSRRSHWPQRSHLHLEQPDGGRLVSARRTPFPRCCVTEIPEHLLARSRARREAIGKSGGDAP